MYLGGRYKLLSAPLSTGSFGSVFMAEDQRMPRRVAVKILHPQHAENPTVRARFRRELEAACRVQHENVVSVYDIGEDPNLGLYYVMELVRGTPLKDYLNGEPLPWPFVYRIGQQLGRALHAIHAANIVHRDLKPQNIMLVERSSLEELVKVLDFGIASLKTHDEAIGDVELTGARMVLGTPPYMSPEQTYMRSDRERLELTIDARSDLYSLGVILYELAAGRRPFNGDAHDIVVAHRLTRPMPLDRMVGVSVPPEFATLVMRCLEKDPKDRPQSARAVTRELKRCEEKPVKVWSDVGDVDVQDHPTIMDDDPVPIAEAIPRDTLPKPLLDATSTEPAAATPRARSLWAPLAAVAAVLALVVVALVPASTGEAASDAPGEPSYVVHAQAEQARQAAQRVKAEAATESPDERAPPAASDRAAAGDDPSPSAASPARDDPPAVEMAPPIAPPGDERVQASAQLPTSAEAAASRAAAGADRDHAASPRAAPPRRVAPTVSGTSGAGTSEYKVRQGASAPTTIDADVPTVVTLMISSEPKGAAVDVDGGGKGTAPVNVALSADADRKVTITLSKRGYRDKVVGLAVGPELGGKAIVVHEQLDRRPAPRPPRNTGRDEGTTECEGAACFDPL